MNEGGCSTCPPGAERYEWYWAWPGKLRLQYDYRTENGDLFSCVSTTLQNARDRRDKWLEKRKEQQS